MPRGQNRKVQNRHRKAPAATPIHPTQKVDTLHKARLRLVLDNEDLLMEILVRSPAKSLTRFKCVCKKWLSIVSSDRFCHQHTLRCPKLQSSRMLLFNRGDYFYFNPTAIGEKKMIPYTITRNGRGELVPGCRILKVCNGLVLLQYGNLRRTYTVYDPTAERFLTHPRGCYCVYNLTTRRSRKIDLMYSEYLSSCVLRTNFAFDPSKSPYYKIICIRCTDSSYMKLSYRIEVYDSESHTWKLNLDTYTGWKFLSPRGTYWNNGIYWARSDGYCCFDIDTYEMKMLGYPETAASSYDRPPILQELNGHLYCYMAVSESIQVWELGKKDDDDDKQPHEWLLKYNQVIKKCTKDNIMGLIGRSDGRGEALLISEGGKIWTYNFLDKTTDSNPLCHQRGDDRFVMAHFHFHFRETLALV